MIIIRVVMLSSHIDQTVHRDPAIVRFQTFPHCALTMIYQVYYRVYSSGDAVKVTDPADPADPWLGRVLSARIPPPRSVSSVKRYLSNQENITGEGNINLYVDLASKSPLKDTDLVDIVDPVGAGSAPGDPVALVILNDSNPSPILDSSPAPDLPQDVGGIPRREGYDYTLRSLRSIGNRFDFKRNLIVFGIDYTIAIPPWHTLYKGDTLYTDGVFHRGKAETNHAIVSDGFYRDSEFALLLSSKPSRKSKKYVPLERHSTFW
jgi:hypothetical protein